MFSRLSVHMANATPSRHKSDWTVNWNVVILVCLALYGLIIWGVL